MPDRERTTRKITSPETNDCGNEVALGYAEGSRLFTHRTRSTWLSELSG
jgi:hypothetical protein